MQADAVRKRSLQQKVRRTVSLTVVSLLVAALAPLPAARATHGGGPEPAPSAPNCEWYGSIEWQHNVRVDRTNGSWQENTDKAAGWSGPSQDTTCRGSVHYTHRMDSQGWSDGACFFARMDGTVPATYEAYWNSSGGFTAGFGGDEPLVYEEGWGTCSEVTRTEMKSVGAGATCAVPGAETPEAQAALQAVVVTCSRTDPQSDESQTVTDKETWTIRMRRTQCDSTVDSDGDDLADCTEFALQTDPSNPDTDGDGLTDGAEVLTHGTDPLNVDTDSGGVGDGDEISVGTDPLDSSDDTMECQFISTSFVAKQNSPADPGDPDHFVDWLRYNWNDMRVCWPATGPIMLSTGTRNGSVVMNANVDAAFATFFKDVIGMKLRYDKSGPVTVTRDDYDGTLLAKVEGKFDLCQQIPVLGPLIRIGIKKVLPLVPERIRKRLLEWGTKQIFNSPLIPNWVKDKIILRGFRAVVNSFDSLSDGDSAAVTSLFKWLADKVSAKLEQLVLGDGICRAVWRPEIHAAILPEVGNYAINNFEDEFPWIVEKDY